MFCINCGKEIEDDSLFCVYCGSPVGNVKTDNYTQKNIKGPESYSEVSQESYNYERGVSVRNPGSRLLLSKIILGIIVIVAIIVIAVVLDAGVFDNNDKEPEVVENNIYDEEVCNEAEKEIKEIVYKNYLEIPTLESEVIYYSDKDDEYIVVVRYKLENSDQSGSYALHVFSNGYVRQKTKVQTYEYDYIAILEELKTIFKLD